MQPYQIINFIKIFLLQGSFKIPPNLIFFVTSKCNLRCRHCFYHAGLNKAEDLSLGQIQKLCGELKGLYRVSFSGGEPFLRSDLLEICQAFDSIAGVKQIGIPTNGSLPERIARVCEGILRECGFQHLHLNLSLDGLEKKHDYIRGDGSFQQAMLTYELLKALKGKYKNFGLSVSSTVMDVNIGELYELSKFIYNEMPAISQHNLTLLRGAPPSKEMKLPEAKKIRDLFEQMLCLWRRKMGLRLWLIKRIMYNAQLKILKNEPAKIICQAGRLWGVVYDNGDVCLCEFGKPLGNIKEKSFLDIWNSDLARERRRSIKASRCLCTHECFLEPSIMYSPVSIIENIRGHQNA